MHSPTIWNGLVATLLCALYAPSIQALKNGLSVTPQMGWNTWNYHGCNISEEIVLDAAKQLKASGLQEKGYNYVWIGEWAPSYYHLFCR